MHEQIDEPIDVLAKFSGGKVMPLAFRWQGRRYSVDKLNLDYSRDHGRDQVIYFAVSDKANNFTLAFYLKDLSWRLKELYYRD